MSIHDTDVAFPFSRLSIELVLRVIHFAAVSDFSLEPEGNPYASALALCLVSNAVRRAAIPSFLYTVVLSREDSLAKFVHALRIQRDHASRSHPLFVDYTKYVRRIWIGEYMVAPPPAPTHAEPRFAFSAASPSSSACSLHAQIDSDIDISIIAPVLLGAPSLGIDFRSITLLCNCLEWAWWNQTAADTMDVDSSSMRFSAPSVNKVPWCTTTLTLSGDLSRWRPLTSTPEGAAFFAHIPSLVLLSTSIRSPDIQQRDAQYISYNTCKIPDWVCNDIPWPSFHNLRNMTIFVPSDARPSVQLREAIGGYTYHPSGRQDAVMVLKMEVPSPQHSAHVTTMGWLGKALRDHARTIAEVGIQVDVHEDINGFDWENNWASERFG